MKLKHENKFLFWKQLLSKLLPLTFHIFVSKTKVSICKNNLEITIVSLTSKPTTSTAKHSKMSSSDVTNATTSNAKRFDGKVWHVHADTYMEGSTLSADFAEGKSFGVFTPDIFLVVSSTDLMSGIQQQLRKAVDASYETESVTIQLGNAGGELGSEMISANLAARLSQQVNIIRQRAYEVYRGKFTDAPSITDLNIHPTPAGLRLYAKLPKAEGSTTTKQKVQELAVKYGAMPGADGVARDVSDLDVTFKVNIFGLYNGAFYLNYRLVAPFRHKDKPEVVAEQPKKARKRAPSATPNPRKRTTIAAATPVHTEDVFATDDAAAEAMRAPGAKKPRMLKVDISSINADDYEDENTLAMAYVNAGVPLRDAISMAAAKKTHSSGGGAGGGGGSSGEDDN